MYKKIIFGLIAVVFLLFGFIQYKDCSNKVRNEELEQLIEASKTIAALRFENDQIETHVRQFNPANAIKNNQMDLGILTGQQIMIIDLSNPEHEREFESIRNSLLQDPTLMKKVFSTCYKIGKNQLVE